MIKVKNLKPEWIDLNLDTILLVDENSKIIYPEKVNTKYNGTFKFEWKRAGKRAKSLFQILNQKDYDDYYVMCGEKDC